MTNPLEESHWITCGNRAKHNGELGYHRSVNQVKECYGLVTLCRWQMQGPWVEDYYAIIECDGIVTFTKDGWHCDNGHEHLTYGSPAQQEQERIEAAVEYMASRDGSIAARLDAGESYRQIAGV